LALANGDDKQSRRMDYKLPLIEENVQPKNIDFRVRKMTILFRKPKDILP
jgi:hypothetical protein